MNNAKRLLTAKIETYFMIAKALETDEKLKLAENILLDAMQALSSNKTK